MYCDGETTFRNYVKPRKGSIGLVIHTYQGTDHPEVWNVVLIDDMIIHQRDAYVSKVK